MENIDLRYICKIWANLSGIPTRVYSGEELLYSYSVITLPRDPTELCRKEIWQIKDHIGYYISPRFHVYGVVNAGELKVVVGPTAQVIANDQSLRELEGNYREKVKIRTQTLVEGTGIQVPDEMERLLDLIE